MIENMISDGKEPQCTDCVTTLVPGDDSDWKCPNCGSRFNGIYPGESTWKKLNNPEKLLGKIDQMRKEV
jgi:predicted RNA-binding Zn-ribbon protein involved in translation (DUF1610 family)